MREPVGAAYVFHGSAGGLNGTANWTAESGQAAALYGFSVSTAGDVNGDGFAEVVVGAPESANGQTDEGRIYVYAGASNGLTSTATVLESNQANAQYGYAVSLAGDVNGDGYSDILAGAPYFTNGESSEGRAYVYYGSSGGLRTAPDWRAESNQASAFFGGAVAPAGDVNGDGYADLLVGAKAYANGQSNEGRVFVYYGSGGAGLSVRPRQMRTDGSAHIAPLGKSDSVTAVQLRLTGRTPLGRGKVKLQWQVAPLGVAFSSPAVISGTSTTWTDVLTTGVVITQNVTGLSPNTAYQWRVRLLYWPGNRLGQPASRWLHIPWNGWNETDFRTATSTVVANTTIITYAYDPLYRLAGANATGAMTYTFAYAYDQVGNRTAMTKTITSTLVTTYTYDAANRLATQNNQGLFTWDNNGNLLADGSAVYAYDSANRLISATLSGVNTQFGYNGDGIRLRLVEAGTLTTYTQDYAAPLPVVLQAKTGTTTTQYVYSLGTRPVAEYEAAAWEYLLPDALGSVRQIANSSSNVTLLKSYEPYGSVLNSQGSATSVFGYAGEQADSTGLVYLRARYMHPTHGIFTSRDPWVGYDQMPQTYNGFNYTMGNPINLSDPTGFQSVLGPLYFAKCFDLHTATPFFQGLGIQDSTTAKRAVEICKAAYLGGNWTSVFNLGQELPTTAHELFGWFIHDWRGKFNSDRLYFDGEQPLTRELIRTIEVSRIRQEYYNLDPNAEGPTHYEFDAWQQFLAGLDLVKSLEKGSLSISMFMGSFWYQIKTLPNDRVGFRIDNDTTLSSGSHVVGRFKGYNESVEELIEMYPNLANRPLQELIKDPANYKLISILENRTRGQTGGQGGGNLYQTFYWTEKRACTWGEVWFGDHEAEMQVWEWGDFKSRTVDPAGWPSQ